ncbi:unnamed protein product [Dovyalis caffra]|uniref:Uncharacterized protein n=1 Tax=Dovyalis caffra TaxID=77055 RepID=A0AAV1RM41_9ROSI|nr:unnamed protein product [Dovyalis caffra]
MNGQDVFPQRRIQSCTARDLFGPPSEFHVSGVGAIISFPSTLSGWLVFVEPISSTRRMIACVALAGQLSSAPTFVSMVVD